MWSYGSQRHFFFQIIFLPQFKLETGQLEGTHASLITQLVKNRLRCRRPRFNSWVRKMLWRRDRLPTPVFLGFPCGSAGKESTCHVGDLCSICGLGRSPRKGKGYPLQYSGLQNSMDYGLQRVRHG